MSAWGVRAGRIVAVVAVGVLALTGCSSSGSSAASSPSPTSNGVSDLSADAILAKAKESAAAQSSVHLVGKGSSESSPITFDMKLRRGGGGVGSVTQGDQTVQVISTGSEVYLKADKAYWEANGGATAAELIGDRWVKSPASDPSAESLARFADFSQALEGFLSPSGTITKGDVGTAEGQPAIALVSTNGKLWVATTGTPLPISIASDAAGEGLVFKDWGATVDIPVPPADEVIDVSKLRSS